MRPRPLPQRRTLHVLMDYRARKADPGHVALHAGDWARTSKKTPEAETNRKQMGSNESHPKIKKVINWPVNYLVIPAECEEASCTCPCWGENCILGAVGFQNGNKPQESVRRRPHLRQPCMPLLSLSRLSSSAKAGSISLNPQYLCTGL